MISATRDDLLCKKIEHTFMLQYVLDNFFPSHNMVEKARIQSLYNAISLYNFEIISIVLEHADEVQSLIDSIKIPMDNATTLGQMRFSCDVLCFFKVNLSFILAKFSKFLNYSLYSIDDSIFFYCLKCF